MHEEWSPIYSLMKYRHFLQVNEATLPKSAFDEICAIAPEGRKPYGFDHQIDSDFSDGGETVYKIIKICSSNGLSRRRSYGPKSYGHSADRWYDDEVLHNAELLVFYRQIQIRSAAKPERDVQGRLQLIASTSKPTLKLFSVFPNWIIVSDKVRQILESGQFVGLRFGEVVLAGKSIHASPEPFWELKSSIVLPKMANLHQFIHPGRTEAEPFQGDYSKIILFNDPPFNKGEVHYRRNDLAALGPFDIAATFENFMEPHPALVISQRLYQHCLKHKIKLEVEPVRIDS